MEYCSCCMSPLTGGRCPRGCAPPAEEAPHILPPGTLLNGRYLVGRSLGQGGFGITYIGRDKTLDIRVAIKEYYPSGLVTRNVTTSQAVVVTGRDKLELLSQEREKFLEEARILARFIGEPGIVDVRDYFQANDTAYIVMEYLDGETLRAHLQRRGTLSPEETLTLLTPVMRSLEKVHQSGLIHRDISPDNIMLLHGGGVKLLDFGTARSASLFGEHSISVMLKPGYAPEEQYRSRGSQGPWTDIYALCATMYRCITGIVPEDSLQRLYEDTVQPPSRLGIPIPPAWEAALMAGMACRMQDRPQTIGALAFALGLDGFAPPPPPKAQPRVVSGPTERIAPPSDPVRATQALFHEQQEPVSRPVPPPQPSLRTPPQQPVQILPQAGTKKRPLPLAAVLGGGAALLAIIFAAVWVLRSGGGDSGARAGTSSKEDSSDSSVGTAIPAGVIQPEETVTLEGYIFKNSNNDEYRKKWNAYEEQYGGQGIPVWINAYGIRFENVISLRTDQGEIDQIQEAGIPDLSLEVDDRRLIESSDSGIKMEVTGQFRLRYIPDELVERQEDGTIDYIYYPNGDYEFVVDSYTLLEIDASAPAEPDAGSSGSIDTSDPIEAKITRYSSIEDYDAPLTYLGEAELLAGYLDLPVDDYMGAELTYTDCADLTPRQKAVVAAVTDNGILAGMSSEIFEPHVTSSIAMLVGDVWRIQGSPQPDLTGIAFQNISATDWHYNAFVWVANLGLIPKDSDLDPTQRATGEDLVALLYALSQ